MVRKLAVLAALILMATSMAGTAFADGITHTNEAFVSHNETFGPDGFNPYYFDSGNKGDVGFLELRRHDGNLLLSSLLADHNPIHNDHDQPVGSVTGYRPDGFFSGEHTSYGNQHPIIRGIRGRFHENNGGVIGAASVPEPSSMLLLGIGVLAAGLLFSKKIAIALNA